MIITSASASSFPDAPRRIYATKELLGNWCGPVQFGGCAGVIVDYADDIPATDTTDAIPVALVYMRDTRTVRPVPLFLLQLDPSDPQVRALASPLRYTSGEGWKDDGLFACGVAGHLVHGILEPWRQAHDDCSWKEWVRPLQVGLFSSSVFVSYKESKRCPKRNRGWGCYGEVYGPETGEEGKRKADAHYLEQDRRFAFLLDEDTLLLPWPGGPRIWRRDAAEGAADEEAL